MASAGGHEYDEHLLSSAPKPDRRALQEGYDPTLLNHQEPKPERARSSTPRQASSPTPGPGSPIDRDVEKGVVVPPAGTPKPPAGTPKPGAPPPARATPIATPTKRKPFYKTRKGLLIIGGVLIAVIVAAVVGGVVGGRNRSSSNSGPTGQVSDSISSLASAAQPGQTQGAGPPLPDTSLAGGQTGGQSGEQTGEVQGPASTLLGGITLSPTGTAAENSQSTTPPNLPPLRRRLH